MTPNERTDSFDPSSENQPLPAEIGFKQFADAGIVFQRAADGRLIFRTSGEIIIAILPFGQPSESPVTGTETPTNGLIGVRSVWWTDFC